MAEPPGGPPTPPGGGAPDWGEMKGKLTATQGPDRLLLITGAVFFICTFLPWYRVSFSSPGIKASDSSSAWGLDSLGVLAALLGTAALVVAAGAVIGMIKPSASIDMLALAFAGGTLLFTLLRLLIKPAGDAQLLGIVALKVTRGIGLWIGLVAAIGMAYAAWQKYSAGKA